MTRYPLGRTTSELPDPATRTRGPRLGSNHRTSAAQQYIITNNHVIRHADNIRVESDRFALSLKPRSSVAIP